MQLYVNSRNVARDESDHFGSIQIAYDAGLLTYSDKDGITAARAFIAPARVVNRHSTCKKKKSTQVDRHYTNHPPPEGSETAFWYVLV